MKKLSQNQIILYSLTLILLFGIPIYMIFLSNNTLKGGEEYLFKVAAFDPYDMLRGNYLNIRFEEDSVKTSRSEVGDTYERKIYYVTISKSQNGYAYFNSISEIKPNTANYYKTEGYYHSYNKTYTIDTPTRYYMNEKKSLNAEELYRNNLEDTYVKVRVKNGKMLIVGVYINDRLIDSIE